MADLLIILGLVIWYNFWSRGRLWDEIEAIEQAGIDYWLNSLKEEDEDQ